MPDHLYPHLRTSRRAASEAEGPQRQALARGMRPNRPAIAEHGLVRRVLIDSGAEASRAELEGHGP